MQHRDFPEVLLGLFVHSAEADRQRQSLAGLGLTNGWFVCSWASLSYMRPCICYKVTHRCSLLVRFRYTTIKLVYVYLYGSFFHKTVKYLINYSLKRKSSSKKIYIKVDKKNKWSVKSALDYKWYNCGERKIHFLYKRTCQYPNS